MNLVEVFSLPPEGTGRKRIDFDAQTVLSVQALEHASQPFGGRGNRRACRGDAEEVADRACAR